MGQQVYVYGKLNINVGVEKTSFKMRNTVISIRPEAEWSNHEQVEGFAETQTGRPNPFLLKKIGMTCGLEWKANQTQL